MNTLENTTLEEKAWAVFETEVYNNEKSFRILIDNYEALIMLNDDSPDGRVTFDAERAFDFLLELDYEMTVQDPIGALEYYKDESK